MEDRLRDRGHAYAVLATVLCLFGCGSSGNDAATPTEQLLAGEYHYVQVSTTPQTVFARSEVGRCRSSGAGQLEFRDAYDAEEGTTTGPTAPPPRTYAVANDRGLAVEDGAGNVLRGAVAADGSIAQATARGDGDAPAMLVLLRSATSVTSADLNGTWHLLHWNRSSNPSYVAFSGVGKVSIDLAGLVAVQEYSYNRDGDLDPAPASPPPMEVVPGSDGSVVVRHALTSLVLLRGGISADKDFVLLGGTEAFDGYAGLQVLVRRNKDWDESRFFGHYDTAAITTTGDPPLGVACVWGPVESNGRGGMVMLWEANYHGQTMISENLEGGYLVAGDGSHRFMPFGVLEFRGGLTRDGRTSVVGGPFFAGASPTLLFAIR